VDKWSGSIEIGVTTHNPNLMEFPATMTNMRSGICCIFYSWYVLLAVCYIPRHMHHGFYRLLYKPMVKLWWRATIGLPQLRSPSTNVAELET